MFLVQNEECVHKMCSFDQGPLPHLSTLMSFLDKMDKAFPLHFCMLQVIKNWTMGRPGNEVNSQALPEIILISLPTVRNN